MTSLGPLSAGTTNGDQTHDEKADVLPPTGSPTKSSDDEEDGVISGHNGELYGRSDEEGTEDDEDDPGEEDEDFDTEEDEDEEEPTLKYERIGGSIPDLLKKDSASALSIANKLMVKRN